MMRELEQHDHALKKSPANIKRCARAIELLLMKPKFTATSMGLCCAMRARAIVLTNVCFEELLAM